MTSNIQSKVVKICDFSLAKFDGSNYKCHVYVGAVKSNENSEKWPKFYMEFCHIDPGICTNMRDMLKLA